MSFDKIIRLIEESERIVITGHKGGDSDCYGCSFALAMALNSLGKDATVMSSEEIPNDLEFLFHYFNDTIETTLDNRADLVIVVDSSDIERLNSGILVDDYLKSGGKAILIDHHTVGNLSNMVTAAYVDQEACATSEIVYKLLTELSVKVDKNIATCLLAGIVGDTSSFQNQNTTQSCLDVASGLMKSGGRLQTIIANTFGNKEVNALKLWGLAMERLSVNKKNDVVSTYITYEDIQNYGLSADAVTGIVNYLNSIDGAKMVMLLTEEEPGMVKVSFRTRHSGVNVAELARQLGGGGHIKAAGASFPGRIVATPTGVEVR